MPHPSPEFLLYRVVEALLFAAEGPVSPRELALRTCLAIQVPAGAVSEQDIECLVDELNAELEATGRPYRVLRSAGGYLLAATSEASQWLERAFAGRTRRRLSQAALEVLAIVAYRQPVTRAEIDAIRGVSSAEVLQLLVERGLLAVVGHASAPGRPALYGTTPQFLALFGLSSVEELPPLEEVEHSVQGTLFEPTQVEALEAQLRQLRLLAQGHESQTGASEDTEF
ncbi:MAG: SMC-Scp complex subunit ScpB [Candidatus Kapabacteria bacterium]|nr:SMC-Scp complex subunit ScpB [Candidatus Kapabacteria bacterium]MCS7169444.1 SMC-Scp complex subunit ScpB [Candidatus Kapabacteria bacterium]